MTKEEALKILKDCRRRGFERNTYFVGEYHTARDMAIEALEQTRWIPVRERLPEDKTYVLTTIKVPNRIAHARSGWYEGGFFHNDNGDTWKATDMEVIAWMPLPEPYKAESEEL